MNLVTPTAHPLAGHPAPPRLDLDWAGARQEIATTETYLVCTVRPDGSPHVVPVLGLWLDDALVFNTDGRARKARNLVANPAVTAAAAGTAYDFTVEGVAEEIVDEDRLGRVADGFPVKYSWWTPTVRRGRFYADESDQPRRVLRIVPRHVFGFGKASGFSGTRWTFG